MSTNVNVDKFYELVVCLAHGAEVGLTKLEKLLYLCDFGAAAELGESITGETYRNFELGPVPKHFVSLLGDIVSKGLIEKHPIELRPGMTYTRLTAVRACEEGLFSADEMRIVKAVLAEYGGKTAKELVKLTHEELTYTLTKRNEDIPYFLAPYRRHKKMSEQEANQLLRNEEYVAVLRDKLSVAMA